MILRPHVLVFGSSSCTVSHRIVQGLKRRKVPYFFADFQVFDHESARVDMLMNDRREELRLIYDYGKTVVSTRDLRSAYFREMAPKHTQWELDRCRLRHLDTPQADRLMWAQSLRYCSSLLEYLAARYFCLLPKSEAGFASSKLLQLDLARSMGFRVPDSYVGNDLNSMRAFLKKHKAAIIKPFYHQNLYYEGQPYRSYTSKITLKDLAKLRHTPYCATLQELIPGTRDIRVGIIGKRLLATEITFNTPHDDIVDFRYSTYLELYGVRAGVRYRKHKLPREVHARCLDFARAQRLQYCMMDFRISAAGEYVFLENNPKGMPGEVEFGGHDVLNAVVDVLADPEKYKLR